MPGPWLTPKRMAQLAALNILAIAILILFAVFVIRSLF